MSFNLGSVARIHGLLILAGCGSTETLSPPPPAPVEPAGLRISTVPPTLFPGSADYISAVWVDDQGGVYPRIPVVTWALDDSAVASISTVGRNGVLVTGVAAGSTLLRGSAGGHVASIAVTVLPVMTGPPPALSVEFKVIEFQERFGQVPWYYAPQVRITTSGVSALRVLGFRLDVPGLLTPLEACTSTSLEDGETLELFPEAYGDFPITLSGGQRASQRTATAFLSYSEGFGPVKTFRVIGPIEGRGEPRTDRAKLVGWTLC